MTAKISTPRVRLGLAMGLFLTLVGAVLGALFYQSNKQKVKAPETATTPPSGDTFFYKTLGQGTGQTDVTVEPAASAPKTSFTLEIRATSNRTEAEELIDKLQKQGVEAYYTPLIHSGQVIYRVRTGMYTEKAAADHASVALRDQQKVATKVVKLQ